jgi:hypothetical protein
MEIFKKIIVVFIVLLSNNYLQAGYKNCSNESSNKLQNAVKNKSLSILFLNQAEKVFNKNAIDSKNVNASALDEMESLFTCGLNYLEKNKEKFSDEFDIENYITTMNNVISFLSARDENGQKKAKSGAELFLTAPQILWRFITELKQFNQHVYVDMVLPSNEIRKNRISFDKYFNNGGFETRFLVYKRFIDDASNVINFDENGNLQPQSYSLVANFALLKNLSVNQLKALNQQGRIKEVLNVVNYYNEFKVRASDEIKSLQKKLTSFLTFNKKAIREKIEKLTSYTKYSNQILTALIINDLYKQIPPSFVQKIADAPAEYGVIFGQTEALLKIYEKLIKEIK